MSDPETLISSFLDGELDREGVHALDAWLGADRAHQRRFLTAVIDHRALAERALARRFAGEVRRAAPRRGGRPRKSAWPRFLPAALAAGLALAAFGSWSWWHGKIRTIQPPTGAPTATATAPLTALANIESASAAQVIHMQQRSAAMPGTALGADDHVVVDAGGAAVVRCADGTVLRIGGESEMTIADQAGGMRVTLSHGRIAAEVVAQTGGHPLVFATPEAEVTVLGTALTVASIAGESLTEVSRGRVSLRRLADRAEVVIGAGEFALVAPGQPLVARALGSPAANRYPVGPGQTYATLDEVPDLRPGDVIEIHPGTYRTARSWSASGTALRPITIRGVGATRALIDGDGLVLSGVGQVPRALFQLSGEYCRIEHLSFANARNGANAAGIRCAGSRHTQIRDCRIARCDLGLTAEDDDLLIEDCDMGWCGTPENDGYCHLLSLAGAKALVRGCNLHDALNGQALKSGNHYIEIRGCRLSDAEDGEITFFNGPAGDQSASAVMIGNLVTSKPNRRGNRQRFIEVGSSSDGEHRGTLCLINNTLIAADPRNVMISTVFGSVAVVADNNIFVGSDQIAHLGSGGITGRNNWSPPSATLPAALRGRVAATAAEPGFVAEQRGDFRLRSTSGCVGRAAADSRYRDGDGRERPAIPELEPPRAADSAARPRIEQGDIGAFAAER